jgi:GPI-anchor transamidase subunit GAA1
MSLLGLIPSISSHSMPNTHPVTSVQRLRSDPRLHKFPPYASLLCILGGIFWLLLLPLNKYSRQTYISENALLPGQVHTYFAGSEQNVFRAYQEELRLVTNQLVDAELKEQDAKRRLQEMNGLWVDKIKTVFHDVGFPTAAQNFAYHSAGNLAAGTNTYSVLHAPRGDGTEAIVLLAPQYNAVGEPNTNGVALLLTLARYFKSNAAVSFIFRSQNSDILRVVFVVERHHLPRHS